MQGEKDAVHAGYILIFFFPTTTSLRQDLANWIRSISHFCPSLERNRRRALAAVEMTVQKMTGGSVRTPFEVSSSSPRMKTQDKNILNDRCEREEI